MQFLAAITPSCHIPLCWGSVHSVGKGRVVCAEGLWLGGSPQPTLGRMRLGSIPQ